MGNELPRRIQMEKLNPAELAIATAVDEVEKMPADVRLTNAVILLGRAKDKVADFIDGIPEPEAGPLKWTLQQVIDAIDCKSYDSARTMLIRAIENIP